MTRHNGYLIPPLQHSITFLQDFSLNFLLPLMAILFTAIFVASLVLRFYRAIFGRFATPEELFDEALFLLKRDGDTMNPDNRNRALDNLRLVVRLDPRMIKGYAVLAKELLYGEINNGLKSRNKKDYTHNSLRQRQGLLQHLDNVSSPDLIECKEIISKGLSIEPTNDSLLKLQSELDLVMKYGRNNVQTRMMNVGSFGWSRGN